MLAKAGPNALPVGAVPPAAPQPAPPAEKPVDMGSVRNLMTTPIRPISGDQARENTDRAELDRLRSTGSGVEQFQHRHKFLGPLVRGLSIAGSVLAPGPASMIPGTDLHHDVLVHQAEGRVAQDIGTEKAHSQMANSEEAAAARNEATRVREEGMQDKITQSNAKFIAGSEKEDPNSPTGYTAQTVGGEWKPFTPPSSYKQTKGESFEDVQRQREKEADRLGLQGDKRTSYIANGKVAEPGTHIHVPSAASEELHDWKEAFKTEHGREPNSEEISAFKHGKSSGSQKTFKDTAAIDKYSNDWYQKQRKVVLDEKAKVHSLNPDAAGDDKQLQQEYARIEQEYKQRSDDFENQKKNWYTQVQGGKPVNVSEPEGGGVPEADTSELPQPIASVRTSGPAPIGGPVQTPSADQKTAKPSPSSEPAKPGSDIGPAPQGSTEGRTGKLADGTKVVVKGGRLVAQ